MKHMTLANGFIWTLKEYGYIFCIDNYTNDNIKIPDDFNEDIKQISGMKSLCAVKNSGELGCWNAQTLIFDELLS